MAEAYAAADLVICRSGAMTVSEIAACGVAACFVPFPFAIDDHQTANAAFLSKANAAKLWPQTELNPSALAAWLQSVRRPDLMAMAERSRALAKMRATERVAAVCAESAGVKQ
jgi:UDP-N-acetylglucosamine--N-acetylmuramyl-(pentapeptide) pyrophosphoryl-undecaprenol N-acetylglucosamine transferase